MKKRINPISTAFVNIGLTIIERTLVEQITIESIQEDIKLILKPIRAMIKVLSDKDPNNKEQVEAVWLEFLKSNQFNQAYTTRVMQAVNLIEDDSIRKFVSKIVKPCIETIRALHDENPNNLEQIRSTWLEFIMDSENINSILFFIFPDEEIRSNLSLIVGAFQEGLSDVIIQA